MLENTTTGSNKNTFCSSDERCTESVCWDYFSSLKKVTEFKMKIVVAISIIIWFSTSLAIVFIISYLQSRTFIFYKYIEKYWIHILED